jgi:hypothetical protein
VAEEEENGKAGQGTSPQDIGMKRKSYPDFAIFS